MFRRGGSSANLPLQSDGPAHVHVASDPLLTRVTRLLIGVWLLLALGGMVSVALRFGIGRDNVYGVVPFLDLNEEGALGTWVASLLLLACALSSAASALVARAARSSWQRNWWVLAFVFTLISLDEVARVHDRISPLLQQALGTSGVL